MPVADEGQASRKAAGEAKGRGGPGSHREAGANTARPRPVIGRRDTTRYR